MMDQAFIGDLKDTLFAEARCEPASATPYELHNALSKCLMKRIAEPWARGERERAARRRAYYLSAEFLVGRAVFNNLLSLGVLDEVSGALREAGADLNALEEIEDAALGNGGLGRLAACFLDSAATLGYPLDGYGIRYRYGLFRQSFRDGFQEESADDWMRYGDPWSVRRESDAVEVQFADHTVRAVPYDMPVIGWGGKRFSTLRLWQSEPLQAFDFQKFNDQDYDGAVEEKNRAEEISGVLYPNDSEEAGKILRIKQQYFFCSAAVQDILRSFTAAHGSDFSLLPRFCAVQLNDTHPTVAICELIRLLCRNFGADFDGAFSAAQQVFHYTNHTVMAEALEKWDAEIYRKVLPDIWELIERIDEKQQRTFLALGGKFAENLEECRVIKKDAVQMANLAVYGSSTVNGVAKLHTEILKKDVLRQWYELEPEKFQNKTNGVTQRRWLALCNPELSSLITRLLGSDSWITDLSLLQGTAKFADDAGVLDEFISVKQEKKRQLAAYIDKKEGVLLPESFLFDIQAKRLHEYKRQMLNALSILDFYFGLKDGSIRDFTPTAFLFGAKAAPGYVRAKAIIKLINEIGKLVNSDPQTRDFLRVVFVRNYDVSYAEKLVCAANLSEQISTAGTEASGTGNMKFMLNGTPTLGTYDGANVEIVEEAGEQNNYIFGARVEELDRIRATYDPNDVYQSNPRVRRALDALIDGTLGEGKEGVFGELYTSILEGASWHRPDPYFLLYDFGSYQETRLRANREYRNGRDFAKKEFLNMAHAGRFSSDRTVREYARDIWKIDT